MLMNGIVVYGIKEDTVFITTGISGYANSFRYTEKFRNVNFQFRFYCNYTWRIRFVKYSVLTRPY